MGVSVIEPLLPRIARGDPRAVNACVERYGGLVWTIARRLAHDATDAEDGVQEIFLELWKSAARFDANVGSESTFVAVIARRKLIDRRRAANRRVRTEPIDDDDRTAYAGPLLAAETNAEAAQAARAVAELRPEQRDALLLATCHGLSHDEIAATMKIPLGTVKSHVRRGLARVRAALLGTSSAAEDDP